MTLSATSQLFRKIMTVCERSGILTVNLQKNAITNVKYAPLGILLKRNIYREWLSSCLNNVDVNMFPLQVSVIHPCPSNNSEAKDPLVHEIQQQYKNTQPLAGSQLPYALAIHAEHVSSKMDDVNSDEPSNYVNISWKLKKWTSLCIAFFCTPEKSMYWFHYWQRQRYVWWRKLSTNPSEFSMSDVVQNVKVDRELSLRLQMPWGDSTLETISGMSPSETAFPDSPLISPSTLLCKLDLDFAVMAYIFNAFEEKLQQGKLRTVLKLHHSLAPYKVTVVISSAEADSSKKLLGLYNRIVQELKKSNIAVLPNSPCNHTTLDEQFDRFDAMGVPYVVLIYENTLASGIAGLRNRDTTLQEKVHLSELKSKLLSYLQMNIVNR